MDESRISDLYVRPEVGATDIQSKLRKGKRLRFSLVLGCEFAWLAYVTHIAKGLKEPACDGQPRSAQSASSVKLNAALKFSAQKS